MSRLLAVTLAVVLSAAALATPAQAAAGGAATATDLNDFDGDGYPDVVAISRTGDLLLYRGNGAGRFYHSHWAIGTGGWNNYNFVTLAGDVDGDGRNDVLARSVSGVLWLFRGGSDIRLANGGGIPISSGWNRFGDILAMDGNGDGLVDLYALDRSTGWLWLYSGAPGLRWGWPHGIANNTQNWDSLTSPGDSNGDGYLELDIRDRATGKLINLSLRADGGLQHSATSRVKGTGWSSFTVILDVGDFNGDAYSDTIARRPNGEMVLYTGDAAGVIRFGGVVGTGWGSLRIY